MPNDVVLTGWYVGFVIAAVTISAVVVLVSMLLVLARRIGRQALLIEQSLEESRENTEGLWEVGIVNDAIGDIIGHATTLRRQLGG